MSLTALRHNVTVASAATRRTFGQALTWWANEMLALLPHRLKEMTQRRERRLLVDVDGARVTFTLRDGRALRTLGELNGLPERATTPPVIDDVRQACAGRAIEIVVRIPAACALHRSLSLPIAAARHLSSVLAFELDRYTPFKADQVYYGFAVTGRNRAKGELQVALTLVPRKEAQPLLESLRGWGLEPTSLEVREDNDVSVNLLPAAHREAAATIPRWRNRALAAIASALLVAVVALPLVQKGEIVSRLEEQVVLARGEALQADQIRKELQQLIDEESAIVERRKQRPSGIQVLEDLTRVLPDSAWLNRFETNDARVTIRGEAANASDLVQLLESSGKFRSAAFEGAITRDARTERERFTISATSVPSVKP